MSLSPEGERVAEPPVLDGPHLTTAAAVALVLVGVLASKLSARSVGFGGEGSGGGSADREATSS